MHALNIEYGQEIELSSKKIAETVNTCITIVSLYIAACISTFKSHYCRGLSMLDMHSTRSRNSTKNVEHVRRCI